MKKTARQLWEELGAPKKFLLKGLLTEIVDVIEVRDDLFYKDGTNIEVLLNHDMATPHLMGDKNCTKIMTLCPKCGAYSYHTSKQRRTKDFDCCWFDRW